MRMCLMEMVLALESVLTPSNCSTFCLNSVLFPSVQCHHANVFDGDGPDTGEYADTFRLLNVLAEFCVVF